LNAGARPAWREPALAGAYQSLVVCYLVSLLFFYQYGIPIGADVNLRAPDLFALLLLVMGAAATLLQGRLKIDSTFLGIAGAFILLEIGLPIVGAVGYRRPVDVASAVRMAMLWLPMIFLAMLAPPWRALRLEETVARVLAVTLWLNLAYALMQIAVAIGALPRLFLVTAWLEPFAVDESYKLFQGLRPSGFSLNSTALSVLGVVGVCFFYARYVADGVRADLVRTMLAVGIVILTTSRTAYATTAVILLAGWWKLSGARKLVLAALLLSGLAAVLLTVENTVGIELAFDRFQRLADSGVLGDVSFGNRLYQSWPNAIEAARNYRLGTLIQAPRALPLIDSGYLNYYLQGRWLFVVAVAVLIAGHWLVGLRAYFGSRKHRLGVMTLFLAIYLTAAMVVSNPLRSPLVIFVIVYSLWRLGAERRSVEVRAFPAAASIAGCPDGSRVV
jgi:hypothetical protein